MKKKNLKSLKLNKKSISNLKHTDLKGGNDAAVFITIFDTKFGPCGSVIDACPSAWICNTVRDCPTNFCEPITLQFLCL